MTLAVIFTSALLAICGYIVNENNADSLLAGYNTMTKDEKNRFDLANYLKFFRKFMLSISLFTGIIYFISILFFNDETSAIIYAICLCIPWPYFIIISNKYL
jgi:ascorbate-specific PTS system EIIC-type component UlaA